MLLPTDTPEMLHGYLARMHLIRTFEEEVERLFSEGRIGGTSHPAIGQEATAVGVCAALEQGDAVTSTHRGHGHFLAHGADAGRVMAELFGKEAGYSRGRGGSQMMADYASGFIGANGITGGSLPIAVGFAINAQLTQSKRVTVCFFGDGASNQGVFHESLNLAAVWKLPVLFVCENNGYAMSTPIAAALSTPEIASRAAPHGIPSVAVDGNDLLAVRAATRDALADARAGNGPMLLECMTYRLSGHSKGDRRAYRSREEEENAWNQEPIGCFERFLTENGMLSEQQAAAIADEEKSRVREAICFAEEAASPDTSTVLEGVFA